MTTCVRCRGLAGYGRLPEPRASLGFACQSLQSRRVGGARDLRPQLGCNRAASLPVLEGPQIGPCEPTDGRAHMRPLAAQEAADHALSSKSWKPGGHSQKNVLFASQLPERGDPL